MKIHRQVPLEAPVKRKNINRRVRYQTNFRTKDADVKEILRMHLIEKMPVPLLAEKYDVPKGNIKNWLDGSNRGHLLQEVEEEIRKNNGHIRDVKKSK